MSIVSSTYTVDAHAQSDGRRYVTERHTDSEGVVHTAIYLAEDDADYAAIMVARVEQIESALADQEASEIIGAG